MGCAALATTQIAADTVGCQSESSDVVRQDRIWTGYAVRYDAGRDDSELWATFRLGSATGTPLRLESPARVSYDGTELVFDALWDRHEAIVPGRADTGDLVYRNAEGDTLRIEMQPFIEARIPSDFPLTLDDSEPLRISWGGPPLESGELVQIQFTELNVDALRRQTFGLSSPGATELEVDVEKLQSLTPGLYEAVLIRSRTERPSETTDAGGVLAIFYQSDSVEIEVP